MNITIKSALVVLLILLGGMTASAKQRLLTVASPNGRLTVSITVNDAQEITYSVSDNGQSLLADSRMGLDIEGRTAKGGVKRATVTKQTEHINAPFYRNPTFSVSYYNLAVELDGGLGFDFRVFDDGIAYRFYTTGMKGKQYVVRNETAEFRFADNGIAWLPYSTNPKKPEAMAFQATYNVAPLAAQPTDNRAFLPAAVQCGQAKVTVMESDLENYPGMFVVPDGQSLKGWFAPYPKTFDYYPWRRQRYVTETEDFIARCTGNRTFPWRVLAVSHDDAEMPVNNLVYALASPNRTGDTSWIQPGLVAWDWWNDWAIKGKQGTGLNFKAGINMPTYKYYIDFAAAHHLPYVILDEGWYAPKSGDMLTTIDDIDLPALVAYGKERGVRLVLWTVFNVLDDQLEAACKKYADMGIAGFKVDFLDRDDQEGVEMIYRIAEVCAKHHLILDYHGIYKPTGINRTYPNIINFESCFGMEEAKWTKHEEKDMPLYDVTFPYLRMQTGFVDFTPGGMRNATRADFQPVYSNPMTMGTRCHQMAMYIVHDSPFTMLADNPDVYYDNEVCTQFIAALPTTFDETRIPAGRMGEYIVTARRKGADWYVAGQTNWDARDIDVPLSFLTEDKSYEVTTFADGTNAEKNATDYRVSTHTINAKTDAKEHLHMASGGGFIIKFTPVR